MEEERLCIACEANLVGPFQPKMTLNMALSAEESDQATLTMTARPWICPGCGLVHWYVGDRDLDRALALATADEALDAQPADSYERRTQMLRMLRRVRRM